MLWLRLAGDTFPLGVCPGLDCVTASAIALIELTWLNAGCVLLLDPATRVVMRELVADMAQFRRSSIVSVPQIGRHRDHRL